jgi:hypothetical protein
VAYESACSAYHDACNWGFLEESSDAEQTEGQRIIQDELKRVNNERLDCKVNDAEHGTCEHPNSWASSVGQPEDGYHSNVDAAALWQAEERMAYEAQGSGQGDEHYYFC